MFEVPKKKRLFYNPEDDLHLLREVAGQNPYDDPERWPKIRQNVLEATGKEFTLRSLKERVALLAERFATKAAADEYKSGIEEEVTELDDLLHAIILLINDFKNKPKNQSKSQYQKGFDKREMAQNKIENDSNINKENLSFLANNEESNENNIEYIIVGDDGDLMPNPDNTSAPPEEDMANILKIPSKKPKGMKLNGTPARVRTGGLKQTSIRYLEKKNDRWYEVRCRELSLAEKKFDLESMEKKRRLEMEETRLEMEKKRMKIEMDIFQNQQKLMEIAFKTRCQHECQH